MNYLLDTHILLWTIAGEKAKLKKIYPLFEDESNAFFASVVSLFEISVKKSLGKLEIVEGYEDIILKTGFTYLSLLPEHIKMFGKLPPHHKDPFDRLLIAQAKSENMTFLSVDKQIEAYF